MRYLIALLLLVSLPLLSSDCAPSAVDCESSTSSTSPDYPGANALPNSSRNMMSMILREDRKKVLSIRVEAFMHYQDRVASILITIKGDRVESEVTRLFFDI